MRRLFTAASSGLSKDTLQWGVHTGRWERVQLGIYADGPEPVSQLDRERATVMARDTVARGGLAAVLHRLDSVELDGRPTRRTDLDPHRLTVVAGLPCADGLQTLIDLAAILDDDTWEQALESALRRRLTTLDAVKTIPWRRPGASRIGRVLRCRGDGPPTESLLETLMVQSLDSYPDSPIPRDSRSSRGPTARSSLASTCAGPSSASSSSSTGSTTTTNRFTMPAARRP